MKFQNSLSHIISAKFSTGLLFLFLIVTLATSCKKEAEDENLKRHQNDDAALKKYLDDHQLEAFQDSRGYYWYLLKENEAGATPETGNLVHFYYKIFKLDETLIASHTAADGIPIKARHFTQSIFPASFDLAFQHMKVGEIARFLVPSSLAYLSYQVPNELPEFSNLLIEVELAGITTLESQKEEESAIIDQYISANSMENVTKLASGLRYQVLEPGTGSKPSLGQAVSVAYVGTLLDGTEFDKSKTGQPFTFNLGRGQVIKGWDEGIALMQKGEKARLIIPSHLAYGELITVVPQAYLSGVASSGILPDQRAVIAQEIPPFSILVFEVTLENNQ